MLFSFFCILLLIHLDAFLLPPTSFKGTKCLNLYGNNKKIPSSHDSSSFVPMKEIISRCRYKKDWKEGIEAAEKLLNKNENMISINPRTMTSIIRIFGESGNLGRAISMLFKMREIGMDANEHHFGALLQSCRSVGQWEMALDLFSKMEEDFNIKRNVVHYNIILSTLADARRADIVLPMLKQMHQEKIEFDAVTYSAAITACSRCQLWKEALKLWNVANTAAKKKKKNNHSYHYNKGNFLNTITFNSVLSACISGRQFGIVIEIFEEVRTNGMIPLDVISFSLVISACGELDEMDKASDYFKLMKEQGIERDRGVYHAYMTACERCGEWDVAIKMLSSMREDGILPDAQSFCTAISSCGNSGQWRDSLSLFHRMDREGVTKDRIVYNAIISALQKGDQWDAAKEVQQLVLSASSDLSPADLTKIQGLSGALSSASKETVIRDQATDILYSQGVKEGQLQHWELENTRHEKNINNIEYDVSTDTSYRTMDLHGFPLPVARAAVDFVLDEMLRTREIFELRIITGRGKHVNNSGTKRVLRDQLESYILEVEPKGFLSAEAVSGNDGCICVQKNSIRKWIDAH